MDWIIAYAEALVELVNEMAPYLLLGFLFAGVLRVVFPRHMITRYMGGSNFRSALNASLLGVPMPLCSCGVLPAGIGFYKNGASRGSSISFLISTPQTGVDSILATYAMLGLPFAIIRPIVALVTGVMGGVLGNTFAGRGPDEKEGPVQEEKHERSLRELFRYGFVELIQDISKWLIIGMLVAALLAVVIPADFFTDYISSEYLAMLIMLLASVPLYVCATGSIPIAAVLLMKGLSPGAALVLLMAGPATNIATTAVIGNTMGKKSLWVYLGTIIGGALLFGIMVNELLPRDWIMNALPGLSEHALHDHGFGWFAWLSSALLVLLLINAWVQQLLGKRRSARENREKKEAMAGQVQSFRVEGMTCKHCKAKVEEGVGQMEGVSQVLADPDTNLLNLQAEGLKEEELKTLVEGLGYSFKGRVIRF